MAAIFDKLGIRFLYPENWTLDQSEALAGNQVVTVYSPGGSFWSIMINPADMTPGKLAATALKAMHQQYDELDAEEVQETVAGHDLVGYDMNFYCLDLTNTAQVRSYRTPRAAYVIFCQADDREFAEVEEVFRAITISLLRLASRSIVASPRACHAFQSCRDNRAQQLVRPEKSSTAFAPPSDGPSLGFLGRSTSHFPALQGLCCTFYNSPPRQTASSARARESHERPVTSGF